MIRGPTDNLLTAAIFAAVFCLLMLTGSMLYAIIAGFDNATDITRKTEKPPEAPEFDPNVLPAPAAGMAGMGGSIAFGCKELAVRFSA